MADECWSALDAGVRLQFVRLLREAVQRQRVAPLVVSQDLGVVSALCSVVMVLAAGRVIEMRPVDQVVSPLGILTGRVLVVAAPRVVLS